MKKNSNNIIVLILSVIVMVGGYFLTDKVDKLGSNFGDIKTLLKGIDNVDTVLVTVHDTVVTTSIDEVAILTSIKQYMDSTTVLINTPTETLTIKDLDTIYINLLEGIKDDKPTWGTTTFEDTSNFFTDVSVLIEWPYGNKYISYADKYVQKTFNKVIGIGSYSKRPVLLGGFGYKNYTAG